jgi:replicative superfamily II helicase
LAVPDEDYPMTKLLPLRPIPVSIFNDPSYEALYKDKFSFFNPIQTQVFHTLYHTDSNVLVGAPTGSGKTIISELAMLRVFK